MVTSPAGLTLIWHCGHGSLPTLFLPLGPALPGHLPIGMAEVQATHKSPFTLRLVFRLLASRGPKECQVRTGADGGTKPSQAESSSDYDGQGCGQLGQQSSETVSLHPSTLSLFY
jgi:hypothetical protein